MNRYDWDWNRGYGGPRRWPSYDRDTRYDAGRWMGPGRGPGMRYGWSRDVPGGEERYGGYGTSRGPSSGGRGGGYGGYGYDPFGPPGRGAFPRGGEGYDPYGGGPYYGPPPQPWISPPEIPFDAMQERIYDEAYGSFQPHRPPRPSGRPREFGGFDDGYDADFDDFEHDVGDAGGFAGGWGMVPDDSEVQRRVWHSLHQDGFVDAEAIRVEVKDQVVTLRGEVRDYMEARYAWDDAWDVAGVRGVISKLTIYAEDRQEAPSDAARKPGSGSEPA